MSRTACPPGVCTCGYAQVPEERRDRLPAIASLTTKVIQKMRGSELVHLLLWENIWLDSAENFVYPNGAAVQYLCEKSRRQILSQLTSSEKRQLKQTSFDFWWGDLDEVVPPDSEITHPGYWDRLWGSEQEDDFHLWTPWNPKEWELNLDA